MNQNNSREELRQRIIDEMNARRIDHKTYIDADWLLSEYDKTHHQELQKVRAEERHSLLATVKAMSWDAKNETPEAVRILKELYDLLSTSVLDQPTH